MSNRVVFFFEELGKQRAYAQSSYRFNRAHVGFALFLRNKFVNRVIAKFILRLAGKQIIELLFRKEIVKRPHGYAFQKRLYTVFQVKQRNAHKRVPVGFVLIRVHFNADFIEQFYKVDIVLVGKTGKRVFVRFGGGALQ